MKKPHSALRAVINLILFLLPVFCMMLYAAFFPMNYMEIEYPAWVQEMDFAEEGPGYDVLILGDSRSKAGLIPAEISENVYNMSVGGATSIEMYYTLKRYLANHDAPGHIILMFAAKHMTEIDNWTQTLFYNYLDFGELLEVYGNAARFDDPTICKGLYWKDFLYYKSRFPSRYLLPMHNSRFIGKYGQNTDKYKELTDTRGHMLYGTEDGNDLYNYEVSYETFEKSELIDFYYHKLLDLCMDHDIQVIVEQAPMNVGSFDFLHPEFYEGYQTYMCSIAREYPLITVNPQIYRYENEFFGDPNHLNHKGALKFSRFIRDKYRTVFQ